MNNSLSLSFHLTTGIKNIQIHILTTPNDVNLSLSHDEEGTYHFIIQGNVTNTIVLLTWM